MLSVCDFVFKMFFWLGAIPKSLGKLRELRELLLAFNRLDGARSFCSLLITIIWAFCHVDAFS